MHGASLRAVRYSSLQQLLQSQRVGEKMSSIPAEDAGLSMIVSDHHVLLIGILKLQVNVESLLRVQIKSVVDSCCRRRHVFDEIEKATRDEAVAVLTMSHRYVPRFLNSQVVSVQFGDEQEVVLFFSSVDYPKTVLVDSQVEIVVFLVIEILLALCHTATPRDVHAIHCR